MFLLLLYLPQCEDFVGVNYNDSKIYKISKSRDEIIKAINLFKTEHPENCPPDSSKLKDGYKIDTEGKDITVWYYVYFYNPDSNRYFNTFLWKKDNGHTQIGLISVTKDIHTSWKLVNTDIKGSENTAIISEFERTFLNPIKDILKR